MLSQNDEGADGFKKGCMFILQSPTTDTITDPTSPLVVRPIPRTEQRPAGLYNLEYPIPSINGSSDVGAFLFRIETASTTHYQFKVFVSTNAIPMDF